MNQGILLLEPADYNPEAMRILKDIGRVEFYDPDAAAEDHKPVTILIARLAYHLNEPFLSSFPNVRIIVSPTTGLNHIDMDYCSRQGIRVVSLKGETDFLRGVTATAELSFALILSLVRSIRGSSSSVVNDHEWDRDKFRGRELSAMTLGILGFGRLGQQMASYAETFGMQVLASDPFVQPEVFEEFKAIGCSKQELFSRSDIVSLHASYDEANHNMVSTTEFSMLRQGSYFVNTSRGELVDEKALLDALSNGHLAGAALDVLADEQNTSTLFDKPLIKYAREHDNLIITPHTGGCTIDSMHKTELYITQKLRQLLEA